MLGSGNFGDYFSGLSRAAVRRIIEAPQDAEAAVQRWAHQA